MLSHSQNIQRDDFIGLENYFLLRSKFLRSISINEFLGILFSLSSFRCLYLVGKIVVLSIYAILKLNLKLEVNFPVIKSSSPFSMSHYRLKSRRPFLFGCGISEFQRFNS